MVAVLRDDDEDVIEGVACDWTFVRGGDSDGEEVLLFPLTLRVTVDGGGVAIE